MEKFLIYYNEAAAGLQDGLARFVAGAAFIPSAAFVLITAAVILAARWKMFEKARIPGWHAVIPFLERYDTYKLSWSSSAGLISLVANIFAIAVFSVPSIWYEEWILIAGLAAALASAVMDIICTWKLARVFGKRFFFFLGMFIFPFMTRCVLGFGDLVYVKPVKPVKGRKF